MSVRTTSAEVLEIMDNCTVSTSIIDNIITVASNLVDQVFENDTEADSTTLEAIEQYLTAHILASTISRTTSEEKLGDAFVKYTGKWGEQLKSTPYGQMILVLDFTGKMAKSGKTAASIYAVKNFE